jgi:DNA-binding CsgD family transcriptional regulator
VAGGVFVGRKRQMGLLKAAVEEALSGHGRMLMLVGEPGIGKTRTAEELKTYAGLRSVQVLWGKCYEGKGAPPYWPWVQAIRTYVREREEKKLRSELGSGAGVVAELIPDIRERLPDTPTPVALDNPESSRFRLFDAVTTFLKSASQSQALVIVLDDLHWADEPSLVFLEFVAHELAGSRLLVLGTYRDVELRRTHPLQKTLGDLTRERLFEKVLLRGLTKEDVGRFIELAAGINAPAALVESVFTHTEGNPLFVTEVVRLLVQGGELVAEKVSERESWSLEIPEGVREVIGRRLDHLSARCNEVLTTASVVGRDFTAALLAKLVEDVTEDRLIELLEEALSARVVDELADELGHYQFTHRLIQETLREELTITRRVRLHARIGQALEELYGDEAGKHAEELAVHFVEAETAIGIDKLVRYSLAAGEQALSRFAWEEAIEHFQRAYAAKEGQPMDVEAAEARFGLARALGSLDEEKEAREHLSQAYDYFEKIGDIAHTVEIAVHRVNRGERGVQMRENALQMVKPGSSEEGRLLVQRANRNYRIEVDYAAAENDFQKALEIAEEKRDDGLKLQALSRWSAVAEHEMRHDVAAEKSLQAIEVAQKIDDPLSEGRARSSAAGAMVGMGEIQEARKHLDASLKAAERTRIPARIIAALGSILTSELAEGDWEAARKTSDRELSLEHKGWGTTLAIGRLFFRAYIEYETGNIDAGNRFMEQHIEVGKGFPLASDFPTVLKALEFPIITRITGSTKLLPVAEEAGKAILSRSPLLPVIAMSARMGLGLIAVLRSDRTAAEGQYASVAEISLDHPGMGRHRFLGLLAHTAGKPQEALEHFEEGLAFCRGAGYRPELAWTCYDYADALMQRDESGDHEKAQTLLDEGYAITRELGMMPLEGRIIERLEQLGMVTKPAYPDGLTEREVEVLRLVAKGFTNKDIAGLLHISVRTVATHIAHIFEKTGCANRAEASAYAIRQGLAEE